MPTTRPRYQVTETEDVERALDIAARRWPGEPRSRLILRLIETGSETVAAGVEAQRRQRRAAIKRTSGAYSNEFAPGYLTGLRDDWPA